MKFQRSKLLAVASSVFLLTACKDRLGTQEDVRQTSATASAAQEPVSDSRIEIERSFIQANFAKSSCLQSIRKTLTTNPPEKGFFENSYFVVVAEDTELIDHPRSEALFVRKSDRMAYLVKSGGLNDSSTYFGPLSIAECLPPQ
jgi:hypothetical protein